MRKGVSQESVCREAAFELYRRLADQTAAKPPAYASASARAKLRSIPSRLVANERGLDACSP
jgi:hypothetical protein